MDACLQSVGGGVPPKWDPRACLGIFISHCPSHAGSVVLVMNPKYGLVSPPFHLFSGENFETVPHLQSGTAPENWAELVASSKEKSIEGFYYVTNMV